jgi:TonB family protein
MLRILALAVTLGQLPVSLQEPPRTGESLFDLVPPVVGFEPMDYPVLARSAGISGILVLSLTLDAEGRVVSVSALPSAPQIARLLGPDAERNVRTWHFMAGATGRKVTVAYAFDLDGPVCRKDQPPSTFTLRARSLALVVACTVPLGG